MKLHNVLGQCFLNIFVLSCDLEPIRFEEGFRKCVGTERETEGESGQENSAVSVCSPHKQHSRRSS